MGFFALAAALGGISSLPPTVNVPASVSKDGLTASLTTNSVTAVVSEGQSPFTYSWTRTSGSTDIVADTPSAASTTFTGSSLSSSGETINAVFQCTVTDALGRTASDSITVSIERFGALSASASPGSVSGSGNTATVTSNSSTCSASGGSGSRTYSWVKVSGGSVTAVSPSSATCTFRGSSMTSGETRTATFRCDVTDTVTGQTASTGNVSITVQRYAALSGSVSPSSVSGNTDSTTVTSNSATASASGGSGSRSYAWEKVSGGSITAVSASSATTTFRGTSMTSGETRTAVFRCVITDTVTGATFTTGNVSISLTRPSAVTFSPVPGNYSDSAPNGQTASYGVSASEAVTWSWSVSGSAVSASRANGSSGTSVVFSLSPLGPFVQATITLTASGAASGSWTISLSATNI